MYFDDSEPGLIVFGTADVSSNDTIYAFDLDHTLIAPASGKILPVNSSDWKWLFPLIPEKLQELNKTAKIVIFTNQSGISKGTITAKSITDKLNAMFNHIGFSILTFISTGHTKWRKPSPAMWEKCILDFVPAANTTKCIFIGDAAGRDSDFSSDDINFAFNIGIKFQSPEQFFTGAKPNGFGEKNILSIDKNICVDVEFYDKIINKRDKELVIFTGPPASGKSFFTKKYFADYVLVNQDTIRHGSPGTKSQCIIAVKRAIASGKNIVIDNTSPDVLTRKTYIDLAVAARYSVKIIHIAYDINFCKWLNHIRSYFGGKYVPEIAYRVYEKKFIAPSLHENVDEIITVNKFPLDTKILTPEITTFRF